MDNKNDEFIVENIPDNSDSSQKSSSHSNSGKHRSHHHHHSSHSAHRHSSSHHRSGKKSKKSLSKSDYLKKTKKIIRKNKKLFTSIAVALAFVVLLAITAFVIDENQELKSLYGNGNESGDFAPVNIDISSFSEPVSLVNSATTAFMDSGYYDTPAEIIQPFKTGIRLDTGVGITLTYSLKNTASELYVVSAGAEIWEKNLYSESIFYSFDGANNTINIPNLKTNTPLLFQNKCNLIQRRCRRKNRRILHSRIAPHHVR